MSLFSFLKTEEAAVAGWFTKEQPKVVDALAKANTFINIAKVFGQSATGQTIIDLAEALIPGGIAAKVIQVASVGITDLGLVTAEASKQPEQIILDGVAKAASLTGDSKIQAYSNLVTFVGTAISDATGGTLTMPQAIIANQIVHNPAVLSAPATTGNGVAPTAPQQQSGQAIPNVQTS